MSYTNSPLVDCTVLSPNHSGTRIHKIKRITIHVVVGQLGAEGIGYCFDDPSTQSSCNYGIGTDGRVCLVVDEANRSWCSSNRDNDQRAITIECASDKTEPYAVNDKVYNKLLALCADICKRNGATKLLWLEDKEKTLKYEPADDEFVITVHRWFANKSCPGEYLYNRLGEIAAEVTKRLGGAVPTPTPAPTEKKYYRVRRTWDDVDSQLGAYEILQNAIDNCPKDYAVYDWNGNAVYSRKKEEPSINDEEVTVLEWQEAAIADGFEFPLYGADGIWGEECEGVAEIAIVKNRGEDDYRYRNLTKLVQRVVGVEEDGLAGEDTAEGIGEYQREHGLDDDECVGINTWKEMLGVA